MRAIPLGIVLVGLAISAVGCDPPPVDSGPHAAQTEALVTATRPLMAVEGPEVIAWLPWGTSIVGQSPAHHDEALPSVPDLVTVGDDGLVYLSVPSTAEVAVIEPSSGAVAGVASLPGPATQLSVTHGGAMAAVIPSLGGVWSTTGDEPWHALPTSEAPAARIELLPDGEVLSWSEAKGLTSLVEGFVDADLGLPLADGQHHVVTKVTGDGRALVHLVPLDVPAEPKRFATEATTVTLSMGTKHGAAHVVGSTEDGIVLLVLEEVESWPELEVSRTAVWISSDGTILAEIPLPPPSSYPLRGEWAMTPDGGLLLLQVSDAGVSLVAWRVQ